MITIAGTCLRGGNAAAPETSGSGNVQKACARRRSSGAIPLVALFLGITAAAGVSAHDITNATLTARSANCADYAADNSASATDVQRGLLFDAAVEITSDGSTCTITSNGVPNHDFNATGHFATPLREQDQSYTITATPTAAAAGPTPLILMYDNAVFLNGVKLDLLAAGCFGVGDGNIGCRDPAAPYRYDPMGTRRFGADEHNAHTQRDGTYHYHGNPMALFEQSSPSGPSPVIGFAADGFAIFGSYIADGDAIRKATSSYRLRTGTRPGGPGGNYDGTFVDDWEYVEGYGDLDACNGMVQDGIYGYVVTDTYPHVLACFTGTPDPSFRKRPPG